MLKEAGTDEMLYSRAGAFRFNADGYLRLIELEYSNDYAYAPWIAIYPQYRRTDCVVRELSSSEFHEELNHCIQDRSGAGLPRPIWDVETLGD